jgi:hypothetical protein
MAKMDTMPRKYRAKFIKLWCDGKRKSGSAQTSLGNGLNNMLLHAYFSRIYGWHSKGCFEGDDSIFNDPTHKIRDIATGKAPNPWTALGILTKIELHPTLGVTSFCGNIFDEQDKRTMTEPIAKLIDFAWMPKKYLHASFAYKMQLLRSKALSLAYAYPGHPILASFARMVLRLTRGYRISKSVIEGMDTYKREIFNNLVTDHSGFDFVEPSDSSRWFCLEQFGITLEEQILYEKQFDSMETLTSFELLPGTVDAIDPTRTFARVWDKCVVDNDGSKTVFIPFEIANVAIRDMKILSRKLDTPADRTLLPASYPYEDIWSTQDLTQEIREKRESIRNSLFALRDAFC